MAGSRVRMHGWRNTRGGQDGRESCRAYTDGATHAEARMAESRVAHTGMAQHTRRPLIGSSRVADSAEKKAAHRWLQAEKCDFGEIQELSFKIFI